MVRDRLERVVSGDHDSHQSRERPWYSGLLPEGKVNFLTTTYTR